MNDASLKETDKILISIVIATFNAEKHIRECIESIVNQAEKNIEIVIVDGGSTDDTISIVKNFNYKKLVWTSEPDEGIYDALNKGAKIAQGKWLYFMGTDDSLLAGFSEIISKLKNENAVYYGNTEPFYYGNDEPDYELLTGKFSNYRLAKYCINHQAVIYPARIFEKYTYDLRYKVFADYALNLQVWGDGNFKKVFYPITIARYNMTGFSSTTNDVKFKKDKPVLIRKNLGWFIYVKFLFKKFKKRLSGEKDW